jgi:hypothetical protein
MATDTGGRHGRRQEEAGAAGSKADQPRGLRGRVLDGKYGVTRHRLEEIVKKVGDSADRVGEELKRR